MARSPRSLTPGPTLRLGLGGLLPLAALLAVGVALPQAGLSSPLEGVKRNPPLARSLCQEFRELNRQGISAFSRQGIGLVAQRQNLSPMDAEVLTTYVVGMHCPDVR